MTIRIRPLLAARLDRQSRDTLVRMGFRLSALAIYVAWIDILGFATGSAAAYILRLGGVVSALVAVAAAVRGRDHAARGGLNHWDEVALYSGLTMAADLAARGWQIW